MKAIGISTVTMIVAIIGTPIEAIASGMVNMARQTRLARKIEVRGLERRLDPESEFFDYVRRLYDVGRKLADERASYGEDPARLSANCA